MFLHSVEDGAHFSSVERHALAVSRYAPESARDRIEGPFSQATYR
jgi:hypothetical protein